MGAVDASFVPAPIANARALPGELEYLVAFDEPQYDSEGFGPFSKAVVWARYLLPIDPAS